jgi:hypothetical protein
MACLRWPHSEWVDLWDHRSPPDSDDLDRLGDPLQHERPSGPFVDPVRRIIDRDRSTRSHDLSASNPRSVLGSTMRRARLPSAPIFALTAALALGSVAATPAVAVIANDSVGGAIELAIPVSYTEDTTGANQSDAAEVALNQSCGAPVVEHGVWFSVTPSADGSYGSCDLVTTWPHDGQPVGVRPGQGLTAGDRGMIAGGR